MARGMALLFVFPCLQTVDCAQPSGQSAAHMPHASSCHSLGSPQLLPATCQKGELFLAAVAVIIKKPVMCPLLLCN